MAGLPRNKYDLLPYSTTLSTPPQSSAAPLNFTHHRPSKRDYIESSDVDDIPTSPPRKLRSRKRRPWRDSSDLSYSSDVEDDDNPRRMFEETMDMMRRGRMGAVVGGETPLEITPSQRSQENSTSKFDRILSAAIMDGLDSVDLSVNCVYRECGLVELPPGIGELKHLVRSSALQHKAPLVPQLKLFLGTGNNLTSLPFELFTLSNLTVLSLWNNNLKVIPQAIGNLASLRELNLSGNQLSYLPHTILTLPHLYLLRLHPNPFLPPPPTYSPLPTPPSSQARMPPTLRLYQCPTRPPGTSFVPPLVELTSRALAENFILPQIDKTWELPEYLRGRASHALERFRFHDTCALCGTWYVDQPSAVPGEECIEWYDTLHGNDAVPIKRGMCSWGCIMTWNTQLSEALTGSASDTTNEE